MICFLVSKTNETGRKGSYLARKESALHHYVLFWGVLCVCLCVYVWLSVSCEHVNVCVIVCVCVSHPNCLFSFSIPLLTNALLSAFLTSTGLHPICNFNTTPRLLLLLLFLLLFFRLHCKNCVCMYVCMYMCVCVCLSFVSFVPRFVFSSELFLCYYNKFCSTFSRCVFV